MASITTRQTAGTGATVTNAPLTNTQVDTNFINLNVAKAEINQTMYVGTTALAINRISGSLALTGITSIDGNAATVTNGITTVNYSTYSLPLIGGTLTGTVTTDIGGGASSSTKHLRLLNGTNYDLFLLPRAGSGSYNNLTQAGDAVIAFSAGAIDTGALVIGPWSASGKGLRIDSTGATSGTSFNGVTGLSTIVGSTPGTAAIGTNTTVARSDHVHPVQTTITGNAGSATILQTARTINGTSFNGSSNIDTTEWIHSGRDFPLGTLLETSIDYSVVNGDPWVLEIRGNSYGSIVPFDIQYQGYIYTSTIINHGGYSNGTNITGLVAFNYNGFLCFWWPTQGYWHGYNVKVYVPYATRPLNKVTAITNVAKPGAITKEVELSSNIRQSLHTTNFTTYAPTLTGTGASGTWPISITGVAASVSGGMPNNADNYFNVRVIRNSNSTTNNDGMYIGYANNASGRTRIYSEGSSGGHYWSDTTGNINRSDGAVYLHSSNYNNYAPTLTGTGASGTWGINITGNSATVSSITNITGLMTNRLTPSTTIDTLTTTNFRTKLFETSANSNAIATARWNTTPAPISTLAAYGTMLAWAGSDTHGFLAVNYASHGAIIGGGNQESINWTATLLTSSNYTNYLNDTYLRGTASSPAYQSWATTGNVQNTIYQINQENFNVGTTGNSDYPTSASYKYGILANLSANSSGRAQVYISHNGNDLIFRGGWGTASWQAWNRVLTDQNYNSYAPTLTGTGASGTWGINVTGNAGAATTEAKTSATTVPASTAFSKWLFATTSTSGTLDWNDSTNTIPGVGTTLLLGTATNGPGGSNYYHPFNIEYASISGANNVTQMGIAYGSPGNELYMRGRYQGTWSGWVRYLNSNNYNSYSPTLTGTGASGTWSINVTGSAGSASSATTAGLLYGGAGGYIASSAAASTSYSNSIQVREIGLGGAQASAMGAAPRLAFHWSGLVASSIAMEASGRIGIFNNPGTSYESFVCAGLQATTGSFSGDITFSNGRKGLVGVYDASQTQAVFAMGPSYILTDGGASTVYGNFYGMAWSYNPDYGAVGNNPQSKAGLAHQLLIMNAGVTQTAIGYGIWTGGVVTGSSFTGAGTGLTGTAASLSIGGNAATATSADQIDGVAFRNTGSNASVNADTIESNGITYYTSGVTNFTGNATDGALYSQAYSSVWQHQIAGDYRSGQIALRGKNNGTWQGWRTVLDSSNYTTYSPSLTGSGASGTWAIAISGNAATASTASYSNNITQGFNSNWNTDFSDAPAGSTILRGDTSSGSSANGPGGSWWFQQNMRHTNSSNVWGVQVAWGWEDNAHLLRTRNVTGNSWSGWVTYLNSNNYNSYAPTLTGSGASGSWGISVTGTAGGVAWGNVSSKPSNIMFYEGFTLDANTMTSNSTGFTYSSNAPHTGPVARFSTGGGYDLWLNAPYSGGGNALSFRTRNGDTSTINAWRGIVLDTYNSSLNSDTRNSRGVTRLYRNDSDSDYSVQTYWTGSYWRLYGYAGDTGHADTHVGYSDSSGNAGTVGTLGVHSARNNEANKVVRTDGNGYIQAGYLNSSSGNEGNNSSPSRVWGTNGSDDYLRTYLTSALSVSYAATAGSATNGLTTSNYSSYAVPLSGGTMTGGLFINNTSPTIYFQDTDGMPAFLHNNSNLFYILRHATANSTGWDSGPNGRHPMTMDLSTGDVTFSGNVTAYSDKRLKTNIKTITEPLHKLKQLAGVSFTRLEGQKGIGLIAQNVQEILPEVVIEDKEGYLSIAYGNIVGLLVEAIKEQQNTIESQSARIEKLEILVEKLLSKG